jgi:hypothetical protein
MREKVNEGEGYTREAGTCGSRGWPQLCPLSTWPPLALHQPTHTRPHARMQAVSQMQSSRNAACLGPAPLSCRAAAA